MDKEKSSANLNSEPYQSDQPQIEKKQSDAKKKGMGPKRNSLLENNKIAKWTNDVFMKKMDQYTYMRSMCGLVLLSYFLGNNLSIFISLFVGVSAYLLTYRIIRFWVKRWILYIIEFCYVANFTLMLYLVFFPQNQMLWCIVFMCSTGVLTWAVVIFNNQSKMEDTDHLTSSWIHSFPLITVWAIRWRHLIYHRDMIDHIKYDLLNFEKLEYQNDPNFYYYICLPIIFWLCWAIYYITMNCIFWEYVFDDKHCGGLSDFRRDTMPLSERIYGNPNSHVMEKYLLQHFLFFIFTIPVSLLCNYNFVFNTIYLCLIILFMTWNAGRKNIRYMEKVMKKVRMAEELADSHLDGHHHEMEHKK